MKKQLRRGYRSDSNSYRITHAGYRCFYRDDIRKFINYVKRKLVKTGLLKDSSQQIVFVMAKDNFWNVIFQLAFLEITGFYPYIVQRWYYIDDQWVKRDIRLIDSHGMMGYNNS